MSSQIIEVINNSGWSAKLRHGVTKFFDVIDNVDRVLYGYKAKLFIGFSLLTLTAPFLDWFFDSVQDRFTYYSTLMLFLFLTITTLAFISAWRDDQGSWTWKRAQSRIFTYYDTLRDSFEESKKASNQDNLLSLAQVLVWGGIGWKATQGVSIFIRKPMERLFHVKLPLLRQYEHFANV